MYITLAPRSGLPIKFMVPFYVLFGFWWVCILCWLAYKNDLLPQSWNPKDVPEVTEKDGVDVDGFRRSNLLVRLFKFLIFKKNLNSI